MLILAIFLAIVLVIAIWLLLIGLGVFVAFAIMIVLLSGEAFDEERASPWFEDTDDRSE